jgi:hypothetical protein
MSRLAQYAICAAALLPLTPAVGAAPGRLFDVPNRVEAFTGPLKLQKTYNEGANGNGVAIPEDTITPYGSSQTLSCGASEGCYVVVEAEAQIGNTASEALVFLCLSLNGTYPDGCPFLKRSSTVDFTTASHRMGLAIPQGDHVVTTNIFVTVPARLYNYNSDIKLYKR